MWNSSVRLIIFSLWFTVVTTLIAIYEPIGIDNALDRLSRDIVYRIYAPSYGGQPTDPELFKCTPASEPNAQDENSCRLRWSATNEHPKAARDAIVTVMLSDTVIETMRDTSGGFGWEAWRPSYWDHSVLVEDIATLSKVVNGNSDGAAQLKPPPAIFLDFIFMEMGSSPNAQDGFEDFIDTVSSITNSQYWTDIPYCRENTAQKLACIKASGGIPLIFARGLNVSEFEPYERVSPVEDTERLPGILAPAQQRLREVAILAPVLFEGFGDSYPLIIPQGESENDRPSLWHSEQRMPHDEGTALTPGALMYLAYCIDTPDACNLNKLRRRPIAKGEDFELKAAAAASVCAKIRGRVDADEPEQSLNREPNACDYAHRFVASDAAPLSIVWGSSVPEEFVDIETAFTGQMPRLRSINEDRIFSTDQGIQCTNEQPGLFSTTSYLFTRSLFSDLLMTDPVQLQQSCPYHSEVPYHAIGQGYAQQGDMARRLFDGRVVLVGARFRNSSDLTQSVVHGLVPGVYQHAMALDNLINWEGAYMRSPQGTPVSFLPNLSYGEFLDAWVAFFIALIVALGQLWLNKRLISQANMLDEGENTRPSHWIVYAVMTIGVIGAVFAALWLYVVVLRIEPPNWIGLFTLAFGFFIYMARDEFSDDLARSFRETPVIKHPGRVSLRGLAAIVRYLDMETIGFERRSNLRQAKLEKDLIVARLYPDTSEDEAPSLETAEPQDETITPNVTLDDPTPKPTGDEK